MVTSTEHIIGIDLGTTNSVVAILENEVPKLIMNAEGQPKTPSIVAILENGEVLTGEIARRQSATQPQRTISSVKRLMGRFKQELDEDGEIYSFDVGEDEQGRATVIVDGQHYSPQQISAKILEKLKEAAEAYLDGPVSKAIITVPAYFDDVQRHATLEAAELAGLEVLRLINEPTAAALAYGLEKEGQELVAIYDFGGGTFDFTVVEIDDKTFEVQVSTGNSQLGGDDLDMALVDHFSEKFLEAHGVDLRADQLTLRRLKDEMERVKCELSTSTTSSITLPFITYVDGNPIHFEDTLSRQDFEDIIESYVKEAIKCCSEALKGSDIRKSSITKVILVGGSTRIPMIQDSVEDFFGIAPFRGVNPDEVVAVGAAIQGAVMRGELDDVILLDVTPHTLSLEIRNNRTSVLISKNSTIPIKVAKTFTTTEDGQGYVNVHLLQGEGEKASDNRSLGKFTLNDIEELPSGAVRVQVEIFVNADGVVELSATESHSGQENKLTTTFSYLNAEERRARQGLSSKRRRAKRSNIMSPQEARKISPLEASVPEAPASLSGLAPTETPAKPLAKIESPSETPVTADGGESEPIALAADQPAAPARKKSAKRDPPKKPRRSAKPKGGVVKPEGQSPIAESKAADQKPETGARVEDEATIPRQETSAEKVPAGAAPPLADDDVRVDLSSFEVDIPEALTEALDLLASNASDEAAKQVYARDRKGVLAFCREHDSEAGLQDCRVKLLVHTKQAEEARDALVEMRKVWPDARKDHYELYGLLCRNYPNYVAARRDRAVLACHLGDLKIAMHDLEFVAKQSEADTAIYSQLAKVYEASLGEQLDSTVQFKLVKMYLRQGKLDEAIALLQQLVQIKDYRDRANKVLGLCFWQKDLRYLAFQKFKALPVDDELKDILYRLAQEMESNDELLHARYAYERIYEADIGYKDTDERLKKVSYRLDLMKDERYGSVQVDSNAETMRDTLIGDRFEIIDEVNRGSMGIVYRATDLVLDEIVAVKVLNDYLCADPDAVVRFKHEARSARRLTHPHVVRIHDFFSLDDKHLISMEFIEGEDMKTILARNMSFTEDMLMNYLRQICDAMAYAHRLGVVHRDIKPANIMIDERNQVKVTDFGIAKVIDSSITNSGTMVMGTPLYMAPEQIRGGSIDHRVDIYALGIMLFELICGSPPFFEGSIEYQHIHMPLPEITAGVSDELKNVIRTCTEKDPDDRYDSIEEIMKELE